MTQSPIEPPNDPNRRRDEPPAAGPSSPLGFDEMVAVLVAFLALGSVLFWGLTRGGADSLFAEPLALNSPTAAERMPALSDEAEDAVRSAENVRPSARAELAEQAARRQRQPVLSRPVETVEQRELRPGVAGTAAGVAGVAATASGVDAASAPDTDRPADEVIPEVTPSKAATAAPTEAVEFRDVPDNYWAKPYIDGLSSRGLISGFSDGNFMPDEQVTRAQIARVVSNTFNITANKENLDFKDVTADYWAREPIGEVVKGGFMTGFPDNTFKPEDPVTHAQAYTTLVTGLGIEPPDEVQPTLDRYTDKGTIPNWAMAKVAAATAGGLVVNHPELAQINGGQPTTRAELSAMIYQALVEEGIVEPVESDYEVKP